MLLEPGGPEGLALLVGVSLVASIINTMAGGGGLLVLPALVALGVPPSAANGTMRVGVLAQNIAAIVAFGRHGLGDVRLVARLLPAMILGAAVGTVLATRLSNEVLKPLFGVALVLWAIALVVRPGRFFPPATEPRAPGWAAQLASVAIGLYGGFLQAGVGFPLMALLLGGLGHPAVRGNAIKVALVFGFTLVSLPLFALAGQVQWREGAALALGGVVGGWIGAAWQIRDGAPLVRWFVIVAVGISGAMMLIDR